MSQIWAQGRSYGAVTKGMDQRVIYLRYLFSEADGPLPPVCLL